MVTQSKGDGFALYNGAKLPNIDSVWTEYKNTHKYAYLSKFSATSYQLFLCPFSVKHSMPSGPGIASSSGEELVFNLSNGQWSFAYSNTRQTGGYAFDTYYTFWSSVDILNTSGTTRLAASDPIPLDGMEVIEWDGDTTGLAGEGVIYMLAEYQDAVSGVAVFLNGGDLDVADVFTSNENGWGISTQYGTRSVYAFKGYAIAGVNSGNGDYTALVAYTAASAPTFDTTTFLSGLTMGLTGKGVPEIVGGTMLYNGKELPPLPEWDREKYPYAWIRKATTSATYHLMMVSEISYALTVGGVNGIAYSQENTIRYRASNGTWDDVTISSDGVSAIEGIVWANFDVLNADGSLYLAASDPVPVVDTFTRGYLLGAELRNKRPAREPVAWLYNGVRLPKLPEWDKSAYPYAYIGYFTQSSIKPPTTIIIAAAYKNPPEMKENNYGMVVVDVSEVDCLETDLENTEPVWTVTEPGCMDFYYPFFSNTDIYKEDGTLYLAASEPVPVYE
jgi:hypothetical protein